MQRPEKLAGLIAECPPLTVQGTKEVILHSRDHGINAGLQYVAQKNAAALPSEDVDGSGYRVYGKERTGV